MEPSTPSSPTFTRSRKYLIAINTVVLIILIAGILGLLNYLSNKHFRRYDWTSTGYFQVSDKTRELLTSLTKDINIIIFFSPEDSNYQDVLLLLKEYENISNRIRVQKIDPSTNRGRAAELKDKYQINDNDENVVIFDSGSKAKYVVSSDIADYDYSDSTSAQDARRKAFKGEEVFLQAILNITEDRQKNAYFLTGHGEKDINSSDQMDGYSLVATALKRENLRVSPLNLFEKTRIPEDCDVLVVAGARSRLAQHELDEISRYLKKGGRMLFLCTRNRETGIEDLMVEWGVNIGKDQVMDKTLTKTGRDLFITQYGIHEITRKLTTPTATLATVYLLPRSVYPIKTDSADQLDKPKVSPLLITSPNGWADVDGNMQHNRGVDLPGPIHIGVAVEKGNLPGVTSRGGTRLVVVGDADFAADGLVHIGSNLDFFRNSVNWLLKRDELIGVSPRTLHEFRLELTSAEFTQLGWIVLFAIPGVFTGMGAFVWWMRRR